MLVLPECQTGEKAILRGETFSLTCEREGMKIKETTTTTTETIDVSVAAEAHQRETINSGIARITWNPPNLGK